jgi:polyvinyl alcohol dehydrogenase (cytochrome)
MRMSSRSLPLALVAGLLVLVLCPVLGAGEDWPKYRRDLANTGHSTEEGIDSSNVSTLKEKWAFDTGGQITASPAVATVGGVSTVFVGNWSGVFSAINAVTGKLIWSFAIAPTGCAVKDCRIASSPAVANGVVYFGAADATLYALNAATGHLVWKHTLADSAAGYEIWSSPAVDAGGTIYVGLASHGDHPCVIGHVLALQASNGAIKWDFTTIDQATCPATIPPTPCVGAGVWSSPAVDEAAGVVYVGTGNPGSTCTPSTPNAAKWPDSILALRASDGTLLSFFQAIGNDQHDLDFGASPVLYHASTSSACAAVSSAACWVSEPSKDAKLYTLHCGLTGSPTVTQLDSLTIASPAVATDLSAAAVCTPDAPVAPTVATLFSASSGGKLSSIDPQDAIVNWTAAIGGSYSAPAVIEDLVFVGSTDDKLYGITRAGSTVFTFLTGGAIDSGPAISNGRIYFGSTDGKVYALSPNGG